LLSLYNSKAYICKPIQESEKVKEVISNAKTNNTQLDLHQLSNGVYCINISIEQSVITKKVILSK
jgi:hypothetical protein